MTFAPEAGGKQPPSFPYLVQDADSLKLKFRIAGIVFANHHAWYGQPTAFVGANPLAAAPPVRDGRPGPEGTTEVGIQGIGPIARRSTHTVACPRSRAAPSGSELFTDEPRGLAAWRTASRV